MVKDEDGHRRYLIAEHERLFGPVIPLIRREHVAGYYARQPVWLVENLGIERIREEAARMEAQAYSFYLEAAKRVSDAGARRLLGDLAEQERHHMEEPRLPARTMSVRRRRKKRRWSPAASSS